MTLLPSEAPPEMRSDPMPVVFVGHGSPLNALENNRWSQSFTALGQALPQPKAIVMVSAHWFVSGTFVTGNPAPKTIHDFGGFAPELLDITYPAVGHPDLAERVGELLGEGQGDLNHDWGFDHGTWCVLKWMYPQADIPVIQLSLDRRLDVGRHLELGRRLAPLRHEGVLLMGSGNVTHNLPDAFGRMRHTIPQTPPWATRFDDTVATLVANRDTAALVDLWPHSDDGRLAHPTPDHWLPLIYTYAATNEGDPLRFFTDGFDMGSISMRSMVWREGALTRTNP